MVQVLEEAVVGKRLFQNLPKRLVPGAALLLFLASTSVSSTPLSGDRCAFVETDFPWDFVSVLSDQKLVLLIPRDSYLFLFYYCCR